MEDSPKPQVRPPGELTPALARELTPALARELTRPGEKQLRPRPGDRTFWTSLVPLHWLPAAASARRRC